MNWVAAYMTLTVLSVVGYFAQTDASPLVEVGGTVSVIGGAIWVVRYLMRAVEKSTSLADARVEAVLADLDAARQRIRELETEIYELRRKDR